MAPSATALPAALTSKESQFVPIIDFAPLSQASHPQLLSTARSILSAFQKSGFLYLKNHSVPQSTLSDVFSHSAAFFARPQSQKDSLEWTTPAANRGYSMPGREKTSHAGDDVELLRASNPDLKESFEIGRDDEEAHPNHWPDQREESGKKFKSVMLDFSAQCNEIHSQLMRAIALGMGYEEHFFDDYVKQGDNTLRLLHYRPVSRKVFEMNKGTVRAGEHSDYGSLTLLFQDDRGGLQVVDPRGDYVDVKPIPGTIIVNAGDLLARWSNDLIKSTKHRVVEPPLELRNGAGQEQDEYPARYSVAYFCNPDFDKWIEALPGTWEGDKGGKRYEGINSGKYLVQRLETTYG